MACHCGRMAKKGEGQVQPLNPIQAGQKFALEFLENGKRSANAAFASCAEALANAAAAVSAHSREEPRDRGMRVRKGEVGTHHGPHEHLMASLKTVSSFSQSFFPRNNREGDGLSMNAFSPLLGFASIGSVAAAHAMGPAGVQFSPSTSEVHSSSSKGPLETKAVSKVTVTALQSDEQASSTPSSDPQSVTTTVIASASKPAKPRPSWVKRPPKQSVELAEEIATTATVGWSGFIRPVDKVWEVSSVFGPRWGRNHNGVDLAAPTGEPILAADAGEVTFAGWEPTGYGNLIEITHKDGWRTLYAHASDMYVYEGQEVRRGECIGSVGETGRATGPHLHWEIRNGHNVPVDPATYIKL